MEAAGVRDAYNLFHSADNQLTGWFKTLNQDEGLA